MGEVKITEYEAQKKIKPLIGDMIDQYLLLHILTIILERLDYYKQEKN